MPSGSVLERIWLYATGLYGLGPRDWLLVSFPKSGSTWVRFFLCNVVSLAHWSGRPLDFELLDRTMPELGVSDLRKPWPWGDTLPRVVKTHRRPWIVSGSVPSILVLRDPRDVMASYFAFERGKESPRGPGEFSAFIRHRSFGLPAWVRHTDAWLARADLVVRYESLKADDVAELRKLADTLEISASTELVEEAVRRSRLDEVRKAQARSGLADEKEFKDDFVFARKGRVGGWTERFTDDDLAYCLELCQRWGIGLDPVGGHDS